MTTGFQATQNKGFRVTFANGWSVSVQWGIFNYCEHQNSGYRYGTEGTHDIWASCNAEVAVIAPNGRFVPITESDHEVRGWCSPDEVAEIIARAAAGMIEIPEEVTSED